MSWVFMDGARVYKLKKPVRFPYLDFSTLSRRRAACPAEANLNRRLARDVYLGVVPLTETASGYAISGPRSVADWLVVMRRLNEEGNAGGHAAQWHGAPTRGRAARRGSRSLLFAYFRILVAPETHVASLYEAAVLDWQVLFNQRFGLPLGTILRVASAQRRFLEQTARVLVGRVSRRLIVDGHGDHRPEHIWLTPPHPIIDCLEFNARLRASDALD